MKKKKIPLRAEISKILLEDFYRNNFPLFEDLYDFFHTNFFRKNLSHTTSPPPSGMWGGTGRSVGPPRWPPGPPPDIRGHSTHHRGVPFNWPMRSRSPLFAFIRLYPPLFAFFLKFEITQKKNAWAPAPNISGSLFDQKIGPRYSPHTRSVQV